MKNMCPPGYHHNGFMATHALMCPSAGVAISHCGDNREGTFFS